MKAKIFGASALAGLLVLAGCAEPSDTEQLHGRVARSLTPMAECNRAASIEYLPSGVRVQVPETVLFVPGRTDLSACGQYALTSVMEAMLDPRIMQVVIEPNADFDAPGYILPRERAQAVKAFFTDAGFTRTQPPVVVQPGPVQSSGALRILLATAD